MNPPYAFLKAPRCSATSKRTKRRCGAPAERGRSVCRFHGARGGGPKGKANGAWRNGDYTREAVALNHHLSKLLRQARETMNEVAR